MFAAIISLPPCCMSMRQLLRVTQRYGAIFPRCEIARVPRLRVRGRFAW